jgi:phosphatidylglycerophosphatase A
LCAPAPRCGRIDVASPLLTVGGLGRIPGPAGTYASAATALALWALAALAHLPALAVDLVFLAFGVAVTLLLAGPPSLPAGEADPSWVVSDEVAGMALAAAAPAAWGHAGWSTVLVAFLLFRVLDVWKPGPIRRAEALPGAYGILVDDLVAGALAGTAANLVAEFRLLPFA